MTHAILHEIQDMIISRLGIDPEVLMPQTNIVTELGVDSVDILDVIYDIDRKYAIELPIEQWMQVVNEGNAKLDDYFVLKNLVRHVETRIEAKTVTA